MFLQQRAASMLTFFLRCPLSIFDVFVITIIIIMTLAPLSNKSLVALKRIETNSGPRNSWREPGVSACQIHVKVSIFDHVTCLQFGKCESQKILCIFLLKQVCSAMLKGGGSRRWSPCLPPCQRCLSRCFFIFKIRRTPPC